ncbi:hypothetical protein SNL152K_5825 [Streptomyces sp. NL15-2K]|nr:hypothetical protein SNL152K_5825 [Streptomyces sp. NL15-2K]
MALKEIGVRPTWRKTGTARCGTEPRPSRSALQLALEKKA